MTPPQKKIPSAVAWSLMLASTSFASAAFAQKPPPKHSAADPVEVQMDTPPAPAATPPPPPPAEPPPPPPPGPKTTAAAGGDALLGVVERLPPTAYPADRVRGLEGGSLWSTFHGMQWPYYPKTGIGVSGYVWLDSGYEHLARGNKAEPSIKYWLQQGRLVLRVTPTWSNGEYFVQGQAELVANKDQSQSQPNIGDVDDIWVRFGKWKSWDVQVGRYEAWEIYHFGMGLDLYTLERIGASDTVFSAPSIYGVTFAMYRPQSVGQAAFHYYATDFLRFELGTQFGNEGSEDILAVRPVGVLDLGVIKVKGGGEYRHLSDLNDGSPGYANQRGFGGSVQAVLDPYVEFGVNGAYALVDHVDQKGQIDLPGSYTTYSYGAFANVRIVKDLLLGAGYDYTYLEDQNFDKTLNRKGKFRHQQTFVALQYLLMKQLYVKGVFGYADADFAATTQVTTPFSNQMVSGRLRLQYLF